MTRTPPPTIREIRDETAAICEQLGTLQGPLLPILNQVQDQFGCVPAEAVAVIARQLNLSRAEVHGVVSFYHLYLEQPSGQQTIYLCQSEACQSMGARKLAEHARRQLDIDWHETTADGRFTLQPIYCLGNCACAPAMMVDQSLHGRVSSASFDQLTGTASR